MSAPSSAAAASGTLDPQGPRSCLVVANPAAAGGRARRRLPALLSMVRTRLGAGVRIHETRGRGDAADAVERWVAGQAGGDAAPLLVLAAGGDGTLHEALNGLLRCGADAVRRCRLAALPVGTGNSLLTEFGLADYAQVLDLVQAERWCACDLMRVELTGIDGAPIALHSINQVGLGFVANAAQLTNARLKPLGAVGYLLAALVEMARLHHHRVRLRTDAGPLWEGETAMMSINNSRLTGGRMRIAPAAELRDGLLDLVFAERLTRGRLLRLLPTVYTGAHVGERGVRASQHGSVMVEADPPMRVMVDGEDAGWTPVAVQIEPGALQVALPL